MTSPLSLLLLMEDFEEQYTRLAESDPRFRSLSYDEFAHELFSCGIFYGDAWLEALRSQGFRTEQTVPSCLPLQYRWAREHGVWVPPSLASNPLFSWYWKWRYQETPTRWARWRILTEQIKRMEPRYIWVFCGVPVTQGILASWRAHTERLLLWWTSQPEDNYPYGEFDLIVSAEPNRVEYFRSRGCRVILSPHAFDPRVLETTPAATQRVPRAVWVGNIVRPVHRHRAELLDRVSRQLDMDFFGRGLEVLPADSPLHSRGHGPVWGKDLYAVYGSYLVTINNMGQGLSSTAATKRIYEATGMGACLVTETTNDLNSFFESDREVVTYSSAEECVEKVKWLLAHPQEAAEIGRRGQMRTLRDHTYHQRAEQLLFTLREYKLL